MSDEEGHRSLYEHLMKGLIRKACEKFNRVREEMNKDAEVEEEFSICSGRSEVRIEEIALFGGAITTPIKDEGLSDFLTHRLFEASEDELKEMRNKVGGKGVPLYNLLASLSFMKRYMFFPWGYYTENRDVLKLKKHLEEGRPVMYVFWHPNTTLTIVSLVVAVVKGKKVQDFIEWKEYEIKKDEKDKNGKKEIKKFNVAWFGLPLTYGSMINYEWYNCGELLWVREMRKMITKAINGVFKGRNPPILTEVGVVRSFGKGSNGKGALEASIFDVLKECMEEIVVEDASWSDLCRRGAK